mmetsp:Transcript_10376/g.29303  ORF Transcript_10376/g.29303 Transcript_10376/m.29303 type:complete len:231 (-) Transcript_10376:66-758(-)
MRVHIAKRHGKAGHGRCALLRKVLLEIAKSSQHRVGDDVFRLGRKKTVRVLDKKLNVFELPKHAVQRAHDAFDACWVDGIIVDCAQAQFELGSQLLALILLLQRFKGLAHLGDTARIERLAEQPVAVAHYVLDVVEVRKLCEHGVNELFDLGLPLDGLALFSVQPVAEPLVQEVFELVCFVLDFELLHEHQCDLRHGRGRCAALKVSREGFAKQLAEVRTERWHIAEVHE